MIQTKTRSNKRKKTPETHLKAQEVKGTIKNAAKSPAPGQDTAEGTKIQATSIAQSSKVA